MKPQKLMYNGAEINVLTKGDLKQDPIVFIHGNSLSSSTFRKQFETLGVPLVAIDLPGHGLSGPARDTDTYSMPGYAKAVGHVIDELQLNNFILAGHSLGGHIAINVAAQNENAKGLLIFGAPPLDSISSLAQAFHPNPLMPLLFQGDIPADQTLQLAESMLLEKEHANELKKDIVSTSASARSSFGAFVAKGVISSEVTMIRSRKYPVAVLHGESDAYINKEYIEGIGFANLWNNKVHEINNSGHCPQLEQHTVFNTLLTEYYNSVFA